MTRRERMEHRADQREMWAAGAEAKAAQRFRAADAAVDGIPFGQPILVGHHSEKRHRAALKRCDNNMRAGFERKNMAERHEQVAETLRGKLETNIFSDDADAIEQLEARIAEREATRDRIKRYNVTCRTAAKAGQQFGDLSILDEAQKRDILSIARVCPYQLRAGGAFPAYVLSNLSANIKSDRDRIASLKYQAKRRNQAERSGGISIARGGTFCNVTFAEKPDRAILDALKAAGFGWGAGTWGGYIDKLPQCVLDMEREAEARS